LKIDGGVDFSMTSLYNKYYDFVINEYESLGDFFNEIFIS